jgi:hypothetical protein
VVKEKQPIIIYGNIKKIIMKKCNYKNCNKTCEKEYCFIHKPKKAIPKTKKILKGYNKETKTDEMREFFLSIWKKKSHFSEVSGKFLGNEPRTIYMHHILPKSKYPDAAFDEENIILLTWEEHEQVENDIYRYEEVNNRRKYLKLKYNL